MIIIKETSIITLVGIISLLYINIIYPYIIIYVSNEIHNYMLIFISIISQIDNYRLISDIKMKEQDNILYNKYLKVISNQLYYICNRVDKIDNYKYHKININKNKKAFKSCGDLNLLNDF